MKLGNEVEKKQILGFAISGILSTLIMFLFYLGLHQFINYQYAYLISYIVSVIALYFMNSIVFKQSISVQTFLKFPLIYLLQYVIGAAFLALLVHFGFSVTYAPLVVVILLLPITFVLNRLVFLTDSKK
jgi:putative flippase GtrA